MHLIIKFLLTVLLLNYLTACGVSGSADTCQDSHPSQNEVCEISEPVWNKMDWDKTTWG